MVKNDPTAIVHHLIPSYVQELQAYVPGMPVEELMREQGLERVSKLASNENPLGPSPLALNAMSLMLSGVHRYPDGQGFDLKGKIATLYGLRPEEILLGAGSEGVLSSVVRTVVQPGDRVLTSAGTFVGFAKIVRGVGAELCEVPLSSQWGYDLQGLQANLNGDTKLLYIANPNNPTGTYLTKEHLGELMAVVPEHCLVVLDEAYCEFASEYGDYPNSVDYHRDRANMVITRTFSKAYGLAGTRVGYGFAHERLIEQVNKLRLPFEPNAVAQAAAAAALDDRAHLERTLYHNRELFTQLLTFLQECGLTPINTIPVTNFVTFRAGSAQAAHGLVQALLGEGVIVRDLASNGLPGFVRVSVGSREEMSHYFAAMKSVLPRWSQQFAVSLL